MPKRIPELERIMQDLKAFTEQSCKVAPGHEDDPVSEMCNDAYLMLEQAREELNELHKEEN